ACRYWSCRAPPIPTVRSRRCARWRRSATARSKRWCCPASATLRIARTPMQRLARSRRLPTVSFVFTAKGSTARSDFLSPERIARAADMHYNSYRTIELSREFSGSEPMDEAEARNGVVDFRTEPSRYRHWKLAVDGEVATLTMDVDEKAGLLGGYELKLNSYDLGVDIELADAVERLRFEHPGVKVVILRSGKERVFCAGANIRMLASATHAHKVNFCKFTNETRNGIEDASKNSGQRFLCVVNGTAAGGGYELALACDHIMLVDDGSASVSLPELPLLAVLPGTGGLTRVTDKRKVRRDLADVFCTTEEGVKGKRAVEWRLVDEAVPNSRLDETVRERAKEFAAKSGRPAAATGVKLVPLDLRADTDQRHYKHVSVEFSRAER